MPARLRDVARAARSYDVSLHTPKSGSHWQFRGPDGKVYPVPSHNGEKSEIDDKYIRAFCRTYGIDFDEFKKKL